MTSKYALAAASVDLIVLTLDGRLWRESVGVFDKLERLHGEAELEGRQAGPLAAAGAALVRQQFAWFAGWAAQAGGLAAAQVAGRGAAGRRVAGGRW